MNEVYIDGVNVAECVELHTIKGYAENCHITNSCCKHSPNCYFKQLQRLKDKSEKISYRFKQTKKANKQYKTDIKNLQAEMEQYKKSKQASYEAMQREWNDAVNKLRDVEAENEKLKETIKLYAEINENDTAYNAVLLKENRELKIKNNELLTRLSEKYGVFK